MKTLNKLFGVSSHAHRSSSNGGGASGSPNMPNHQQTSAGTPVVQQQQQPQQQQSPQQQQQQQQHQPQQQQSPQQQKQEPLQEDEENKPQAPTSFYCPVSMELMADPVMVATGHTYDRICMEKWIKQGNRTCPCTGSRLLHLELTPNYALRTAIQEWAHNHGVPLGTHSTVTPEKPRKERSGQQHSSRRESSAAVQQQPAGILQGHDEIVWALEAFGDRLVSASADKTIRVWDVPSRRCERVLGNHTRPVLSLAVSNGRLYSGSYDYTIKVCVCVCVCARARAWV